MGVEGNGELWVWHCGWLESTKLNLGLVNVMYVHHGIDSDDNELVSMGYKERKLNIDTIMNKEIEVWEIGLNYLACLVRECRDEDT